MSLTVVFSHPDFERELVEECARRGAKLDRLAKNLFSVSIETRSHFLQHNTSLVWARDTWREAEEADVASIAKAALILRAHSKLPWTHVSTVSHRRGELIELTFGSKSKVAKVRAEKVAWPDDLNRRREQPAFTLLSEDRMLFCANPSEEVPGGEWRFLEDRKGPPSRAYLKLWEWGWRTKVLPTAGQIALDLGASPGGWTWVLASNGVEVHAFDRSPLSEAMLASFSREVRSRIHFSKQDAFQVTPGNAVAADWVFCDVIAEPKRTVELIEGWLDTAAGLVFTVKFKGETDFDVIDQLQAIEGGVVRHLDVNKHEVTFWRAPVSI